MQNLGPGNEIFLNLGGIMDILEVGIDAHKHRGMRVSKQFIITFQKSRQNQS